MLLSMALILAVASAYIEFKILKAVPLLGRWNRKSMAFGLVLSFAISAALGALFGAAGLVVMMAGVVSTALTEPVHEIRRRMDKAGVDTRVKIERAKKALVDTKDTYRPVGKAVKWTAIVGTSPVWVPVVVRRKYVAWKGEAA